MTSDWIMTASGRPFYPLEPRLEDITISDIGHALGAVNRFQGHTAYPYSVAQHSVLVSHQLEPDGVSVALVGLLHDASEAYLGDVPRPLKRHEAFAGYRTAEAALQGLIFEAFDLTAIARDPYVIDLVKTVDRRMLRTEQQFLMPPPAPGENRSDVALFPLVITPWTAAQASARFLDRFHRLTALRRQYGGDR